MLVANRGDRRGGDFTVQSELTHIQAPKWHLNGIDMLFLWRHSLAVLRDLTSVGLRVA